MTTDFKIVTDVELLQEKIDAVNVSPVLMAAAWGVSLPTYYKLKAGESEFTASTLVRASFFLGLTKEERDLIFLTKRVSITHE